MVNGDEGKTVVVGAGYVGGELLRQLEAAGRQAVGVRRTASDGFLAADVSSKDSLVALRDEVGKVGSIVHCASSGRGGVEAYRQVFLVGAQNLIEVFPTTRLVFVSSTSVYPQLDGSVVTETSEVRGSRPTSRLLVEAEALVLEAGGTVARLSGIYGPDRSVVLRRFLSGEATMDAGGLAEGLAGGRLLNQIHRDDAASGIAFLLDLPTDQTRGEAFNVSDCRPLFQAELYGTLAERFSLPMPGVTEPDANRKRAWTHKAVSSEKLRGQGWELCYPDYVTALEKDQRLIPSIQAQLD